MRFAGKLLIFGLIIFFSTNYSLKANHVLGSEITYECIGEDNFKVIVNVYRDCNGINILNINLDVEASNGAFDTSLSASSSISTPVNITPTCSQACNRCSNSSCSFGFGVEKYTLYYIVDLTSLDSSDCEIVFSWSQCCRPSSIGIGGNYYFDATLNRCNAPCNNSPVFGNDPLTIVCSREDVVYNPSVLDFDSQNSGNTPDSLLFEFACARTSRGTSINYPGNYSCSRPFSFWGIPNANLSVPKGLHIDENTGTVKFRPMRQEIVWVTIKISEYRKGKFIGDITRDVLMTVIQCSNNSPPQLSGINYTTSFQATICANEEARLLVGGNEPDKDSLRFNIENGNVPGSPKFSSKHFSKSRVEGLFQWTPDTSHIRDDF